VIGTSVAALFLITIASGNFAKEQQ